MRDAEKETRSNAALRRKKKGLTCQKTNQSLFWWGMVDSNHRRRCQQIYSLSPLATREIPHIALAGLIADGAGRRTRTPDLLITNQLLYQLSYTSISNEHAYYITLFENVKRFFAFLLIILQPGSENFRKSRRAY